jgi:uncharacterized membrane protein YqjE
MTVSKTNGNQNTTAERTNGNARIYGGDTRTLGELFGDLAAGVQLLVSQEIRLAKLEMRESVKNAGMGAGFFAGAGAFGLVGLIGTAFTLGALLALILPVWTAALIVTVIYLGIAGALALIGRSRLKQANPVPEATIETLKEDQEWLKQQIK